MRSRRVNFLNCRYWNPGADGKMIDKNKLTHDTSCDGYFDAKIESRQDDGKQVVSQSFLFNSSNITISTNEPIDDIKVNALVELLGTFWRVDSVGKAVIRTIYQLDNEVQFKYILELRR